MMKTRKTKCACGKWVQTNPPQKPDCQAMGCTFRNVEKDHYRLFPQDTTTKGD